MILRAPQGTPQVCTCSPGAPIPRISGTLVQNWERRREACQGKVGLWAEAKGSESQLDRRAED